LKKKLKGLPFVFIKKRNKMREQRGTKKRKNKFKYDIGLSKNFSIARDYEITSRRIKIKMKIKIK